MEYAILSDIHGNIGALDAVLADIAARRIAHIVNLGDILSGPLFPRETADRLMALNLPTIRGNHERQLLTQAPGEMSLSDRYAAGVLRPKHLAWIADLPTEAWLTQDVLMVHGTPGSDIEYFLHSVTPDGLRPATREELAQRAGGVAARVILCGHTHLPGIARGIDGRLIVNPGSVGLPAYEDDRPWPHRVETGSPHARYAVLRNDGDDWSAQLVQVAYDWDAAADVAEARGRPDWGRALRTGRV